MAVDIEGEEKTGGVEVSMELVGDERFRLVVRQLWNDRVVVELLGADGVRGGCVMRVEDADRLCRTVRAML